MVGSLEKVNAIIFDVGNVIIGFNHQAICEHLKPFTTLSVREIYQGIFSSGCVRQYDEGNISSKEFHEITTKRIQADSRLTFQAFVQAWQATFIENPDIDRLLNRIKPEIKKILLSNTNELHWRFVAGLPIIKRHFADAAVQVLSFRLGVSKPNEVIFQEAITRCSSTPEEILYVDDVAAYVEAFIRFGGRGVIYNCQTDPIEKLERELSSWNLLEQRGQKQEM